MSWFRRQRGPEPAGGAEAPGVGLGNPWNEADSAAIIRDCCAEHGAAIVVVWPQGHVGAGRFGSTGEHELRIEMQGACEPADFPPLAVANVSFHRRGRALVFLTPVLGLEPPAGADALPVLRLLTPNAVTGAEARLNYRVPAPEDGRLTAELHTESGDALPGRVINLSVTGALVELPPAVAREVAVGHQLSVRLQHGKTTLRVDAVVRRAEGTRFGLFFPGIFERSESPEARTLRALIEELVTGWPRH